jgi:hypothetical protein
MAMFNFQKKKTLGKNKIKQEQRGQAYQGPKDLMARDPSF